MKLFTTILLAATLAASPLQAQQKGEPIGAVVLCELQEDALVAASKWAHDGPKATQEYLEDPDNSCALLFQPIMAFFEKVVKEISGKAGTIRVVEVKSMDGVQTGYVVQKRNDVGA